MNRKRKILRNIIFIAIFISFALLSGMFYIDPVAAYRGAERSIHYGPSEVVHVKDFPGGKYILGKYDRWISCNIMQKSMGVFWSAGSYITGTEIRYDHPIYYEAQYGQPNARAYGIRHDESITKVEVHLMDGTILSQEEFHEDLFLLTWERASEFKKIIAYDDAGRLVFQEERLHY